MNDFIKEINFIAYQFCAECFDSPTHWGRSKGTDGWTWYCEKHKNETCRKLPFTIPQTDL